MFCKISPKKVIQNQIKSSQFYLNEKLVLENINFVCDYTHTWLQFTCICTIYQYYYNFLVINSIEF